MQKNGQTRVTNAKAAKAIAHICQVFENADALFDKQPAASVQCPVSAKKPQVAKQPAGGSAKGKKRNKIDEAYDEMLSANRKFSAALKDLVARQVTIK